MNQASVRADAPVTLSDVRPGRIRSIDGLRALAITAVLLYHCPATSSWVRGGWLGVDLFFVISGYLITDQLLRVRDRPFGTTIRDFYRRRARRLLPALGAMVFVWTFFVLLAMTGIVSVWPVSSPSSADLGWMLAMVAVTAGIAQNWLQAFDPTDVAMFSPRWSFGNLWSLCVEEQFYLLWPLITRIRRVAIGVLTAVLAFVSVAMPAILDSASGQRLYFGTDTRCVALLGGAALAQIAYLVPRSDFMRRTVYFSTGLCGLFLVVQLHTASDDSALRAPFEYGEIAVAATVLVGACALFDPAGPLCWRPVQWLGRRSYAVYLWQGPFAAWFVPRGGLWWLVALAGTLLAAELSWRFVERRWTNRRPLTVS